MQYIYRHFKKASDAIIHTNWLLHANETLNHSFFQLWTTENAIFLGSQDISNPHIQQGIESLPYPALLRSSGGRAVVNDEGILNLSLFTCDPLSVNDAYQKMQQLIDHLFSIQTEAKEIKGSYCPGKFDLSLQHKKIAGLSQRRYKNSIVIMAYISIDGDQYEREKIIQRFYRTMNDSTIHIQLNTMTTLPKEAFQQFNKTLSTDFDVLEVAPFLQFHHTHPELIAKMKQHFQQQQQRLEEINYGKSIL